MTIANAIYECNDFGPWIPAFDPEDLTKDLKLLIIHGGDDISPTIYNEVPSVHTRAGARPSKRDQMEIDLINRAWELGIPVLGICRGAQLLCALNGGSLYQDVPNHSGVSHNIYTDDGKELQTNSFHHQMMIPSEEGKVIAHAGKYQARRWKRNTYVMEDIFEPEIVYWEKTKSLGVQGHPEWDARVQGGIYWYTKELLKRFFKYDVTAEFLNGPGAVDQSTDETHLIGI